MDLQPGPSATVALTVTHDDTAEALGSGTVAVLATPRVVALVEEATVAAVADLLSAGTTTVGTEIALRHVAATRVGSTVVAEAVLVAVAGRTLTFDVRVTDAAGEVAAGTVTRAVVDVARFLARAR